VELNESARRILGREAEHLRRYRIPEAEKRCEELAEQLQMAQASLDHYEREFADLAAVIADDCVQKP
jgi:molecular chaperone GrpE (heat shock protein)